MGIFIVDLRDWLEGWSYESSRGWSVALRKERFMGVFCGGTEFHYMRITDFLNGLGGERLLRIFHTLH